MYNKPVCRGSWVLGTACGRCERCEDARPGKPLPVAPNPQEGGKHTPGTWEWTRSDGELTALVARHPEGGGAYVISPGSQCDDDRVRVDLWLDVSVADARLLSAAPAMFAALKAILSNSNRADITVMQWRAGLDALLQATGGENGR